MPFTSHRPRLLAMATAIATAVVTLTLGAAPASAADLDGSVRTADGSTLAAAAVDIQLQYRTDGLWYTQAETANRADGSWAFPSVDIAGAEAYRVVAVPSDRRWAPRVSEVVAVDAPATFDLVLDAGATIRGAMDRVDGSAAWWGFARYVLHLPDGSIWVGEPQGAGQGSYTLTGVPAGSISVSLSNDGDGTGPEGWRLGAWSTDQLNRLDGERFDVEAGAVIDGKDITVFGDSSVNIPVTGGECTAEDFPRSGVLTLERRLPGERSWVTASNDTLRPGSASVRFTTSRAIGEFRVRYSGGCGWAAELGSAFTMQQDARVSGPEIVVSRPHVYAMLSDGRLARHASDGARLGRAEIVRTKLGKINTVVNVGDVNADGNDDLLLRTAKGTLLRMSGTALGGFRAPVIVSRAWAGYREVLSGGDVNGDGNVDLVTRTTAGTVQLHRGDGRGGFGAPTRLGRLDPRSYPTIGVDVDRFSDGSLIVVGKSGGAASFTLTERAITKAASLGRAWAGAVQIIDGGTFDRDVYADMLIRTSTGSLLVARGRDDDGYAQFSLYAKGWSGRVIG